MRRIALAFITLSFTGLCCAASDSVPRPEVKPGDSWTYRRVDYSTNRPRPAFTETVTFANERVIEIVGNRARGDKELDTNLHG